MIDSTRPARPVSARRARALAFAAALLSLAAPRTLLAHGEKTSSELEIRIDGARIEVELLLALHDLAAAIFPNTDGDGDFEAAEADASVPAVLEFARRRFRVEAPGVDLAPAGDSVVRYDGTLPATAERFESIRVVARWGFEASRPPASVRLTLDYPQTGHHDHVCHFRFRWDGREEEGTLGSGDEIETFRPRGRPVNGEPTPPMELAGLLSMPSLWALVAGIALSSSKAREAASSIAGFELGFGLAAIVVTVIDLGRGALFFETLAAAAVVYLAARNADLCGPAKGRWAVASGIGALQGLGLPGGAAVGPLLGAVGTTGAAALVLAAAGFWATRAAGGRFAPAMAVGTSALLAACGATLFVFAVL